MKVALEAGEKWTFASALDWPGWCRRGRGDDAAVQALLGYADRYRLVAGDGFRPGPVQVVGRADGGSAIDFGAPGPPQEWDRGPAGPAALGLLRACWDYFDQVVASSPPELRKGPRGGGRDRDAMVDHVREAERSYASKAGVRVAPRTPWPEQREMLVGVLGPGGPDARWPVRYSLRRIAWHVLDHAWEMEDRRA